MSKAILIFKIFSEIQWLILKEIHDIQQIKFSTLSHLQIYGHHSLE